MDEQNLQRILAICGIAAPVFFALLVIVGGANYPGYSHLTQAISELGGVEAPNPAIQNANFAILGVLLVAFTIGLQRNLKGVEGSTRAVALVAAFGFVAVAHSALPCDAGCEWVSPMGIAHNATGLVGFLALISGIFLTSRVFASDPNWKSFRAYSLTTAIMALSSLALWIALGKAAKIAVMNGSLQRVFVATVLLWVLVTAMRHYVLSRSIVAPKTEQDLAISSRM